MLSRIKQRGPSAAHKPNLNESGHQPEMEANKRARSLFSKKIHHHTENLNSFGTESSTLYYKDIDIEGIANDGFGYTVTISGGVGFEKVGKMTKRQRVMKALSGSEESLDQAKSAARAPPESLSGQTIRNAASRRSMRDTASKGSMAKRKKENEILDIDDKYDTDITAQRTFEIRESYHEEYEKSWDPRNPYRKQTTEEDPPLEQHQLSPRTADWANLGGEIRHMKSILPNLGKKDSKASFEEPRYESPTTAGLQRHDSQDKNSRRPLTGKDLLIDRSESNASPHQMFPQQAYPRIGQAQRMNTPSPPPNQSSVRASPVVQPINSSQWWANRTPQSTLSRAHSPPISSMTGDSSELHIAPSETKGTWTGPLEVDTASAWDKDRTNSLQSSVGAMDGSRMPSLKSKDFRSYEDSEDGTVSMDEDSFSLPIEKPPSWHGGPLWERNRVGSVGRPRTSQVPISWVGANARPGTSFTPPARPGTAW